MLALSAAVVVAALSGLVAGVTHEERAVDHLGTKRQVATAELDDNYFLCIGTQLRSLVVPGEAVTLDSSNFANEVSLLQGAGAMLHVVNPADRSVPQLALVNRPGKGSCSGQVVVARSFGRRGNVTERFGTGAFTPGSHPPPRPGL